MLSDFAEFGLPFKAHKCKRISATSCSDTKITIWLCFLHGLCLQLLRNSTLDLHKYVQVMILTLLLFRNISWWNLYASARYETEVNHYSLEELHENFAFNRNSLCPYCHHMPLKIFLLGTKGPKNLHSVFEHNDTLAKIWPNGDVHTVVLMTKLYWLAYN